MSFRAPSINYPFSDEPVDLTETILDVSSEGIATLAMNRPEIKNAMTRRLAFEVAQLLVALDQDDDVRGVVLTGTGEAFCSGAYLKGGNLHEGGNYSHHESLHRHYPIPNQTRAVRTEPIGWWGPMVKTIFNYSKPIVAAVGGPAFGGGFGLACACDFRIVSDRGSFASIFIKRGFGPEVGTTFHLPRIVGFQKALELVMTGRTVNSEEALALGLADRVVPHESLQEAATDFMRELTVDKPLVALAVTRKIMYQSLEVNNLTAQLGMENGAGEITSNAPEDRAESFKSFVEKRPGKYVGQ
jgi:2-(1,2-epoxy-1,2-dihydrophenyl)acetyl-CoA isomerase